MTPKRLRELLRSPLSPAATTDDLTPAAVLVPLFLQEGALQVILTQRTNLVREHRGQISFPGGVHDPGDASSVATALRETQEEIGLDPEAVEVLGSLQPISTSTGYLIQSLVGLIPFPYPFQLNTREVARLIVLPVRSLLEPARWSSKPFDLHGRTRKVYYCQYEDTLVWGATAQILINLLTRLNPTFYPAEA